MITLTLLALITVFGVATAEDVPAPNLNIEAPYQLSPEGLQTLQENIAAVKASIQGTHKNIDMCRKNIATLKQEISELNQFETEHVALQSKYAGYIRSAKALIAKNEQVIGRIQSWKIKMESEKATNPKAERAIAAAEAEKISRAEWAKDASAKIETISNLQISSTKDENTIAIRRTESQRELLGWEKRILEFEGNLKSLGVKQGQYETILAKQLNQ